MAETGTITIPQGFVRCKISTQQAVTRTREFLRHSPKKTGTNDRVHLRNSAIRTPSFSNSGDLIHVRLRSRDRKPKNVSRQGEIWESHSKGAKGGCRAWPRLMLYSKAHSRKETRIISVYFVFDTTVQNKHRRGV